MKLIRKLLPIIGLLCYSAGYALKIPHMYEVQTTLLAVILILDMLDERGEGRGDDGRI